MIQSKNAKWIIFDRFDYDISVAETEDDARDIAGSILTSYCKDDEGIPEGIMNGDIMIAKVVARSAFDVIDEKKNYDDEDNWPYDSCFDMMGDLYIQDIEEEKIK